MPEDLLDRSYLHAGVLLAVAPNDVLTRLVFVFQDLQLRTLFFANNLSRYLDLGQGIGVAGHLVTVDEQDGGQFNAVAALTVQAVNNDDVSHRDLFLPAAGADNRVHHSAAHSLVVKDFGRSQAHQGSTLRHGLGFLPTRAPANYSGCASVAGAGVESSDSVSLSAAFRSWLCTAAAAIAASAARTSSGVSLGMAASAASFFSSEAPSDFSEVLAADFLPESLSVVSFLRRRLLRRPPSPPRPEDCFESGPESDLSFSTGSSCVIKPRPPQWSPFSLIASTSACPARLRVICTGPSEVTSATWCFVRSRPRHSTRRRITRSRFCSRTMSMKSITMMPPISRRRS